MMTIKKYAQEIANIVGGKVTESPKANGIVMTGITIMGDKNIAPTVYVDGYYKQNIPVSVAAESIKEVLNNHKVENDFDADCIMNWDTVKSNLRARLYNNTTKADVYRSAKSYGFDDLIIVPAILVTGSFGNGSIKVTNQIMERWGVTKRTVIDTALRNSAKDVEIMSMAEVIRQMMGPLANSIFGPEDDGTMYVISNKDKSYGAIAVIGARERLREMFPNGYTVLPSSIHEVIVVPNNLDAQQEMLTQMVREVNAEQVAPEERLGDRAYNMAA